MKLTPSDLRVNIIPFSAYFITFGLGFYGGNFLLYGLSLNRLFLVAVLVMACLPMSKMRFSAYPIPEKTMREKARALLIMGAIQWGMTIIFYTLYSGLLHYLPLTEGLSVMTEQQLTANIINDLGWQWGLYPWPLVALLGAGIALFYHKKQQPILMGELLYPYGTQAKTPIRVYSLNMFCTAQAALWAWFTLGAFTLGWVSWMGRGLHLSLFHHLDTKAIVIGLLLMGLHQTPAMKDFQGFVSGVTQRHGLYGLAYMVFVGLALLLFNFVFTVAPQLSSSINNTASLASHVIAYNDLSTAYQLVTYGWWTMSVPVMAYIFAYYAERLSVRFFLLGSLLNPLFISTVMPVFASVIFWQNVLLLLLGTVCFLSMLYTMKNNVFLSCGFFPPPTHFRIREGKKYIATAFSMSTAFILLFIISDAYGLQVAFLLFALCGTFCFTLLSITTLIHIITREREKYELCVDS